MRPVEIKLSNNTDKIKQKWSLCVFSRYNTIFIVLVLRCSVLINGRDHLQEPAENQDTFNRERFGIEPANL